MAILSFEEDSTRPDHGVRSSSHRFLLQLEDRRPASKFVLLFFRSHWLNDLSTKTERLTFVSFSPFVPPALSSLSLPHHNSSLPTPTSPTSPSSSPYHYPLPLQSASTPTKYAVRSSRRPSFDRLSRLLPVASALHI